MCILIITYRVGSQTTVNTVKILLFFLCVCVCASLNSVPIMRDYRKKKWQQENGYWQENRETDPAGYVSGSFPPPSFLMLELQFCSVYPSVVRIN